MALLKLLVCVLVFYLQNTNAASLQDAQQNISPLEPKPASRYVIGEDSVRLEEAKGRCAEKKWELAQIRTKGDLKELKKRLDKESNAESLWIGGLFDDSEECSKNPFANSCWYWDDDEEEPSYYDPTIIQFTDTALDSTPPTGSAMLVVPGRKLQLDYDTRENIHTYVCDRNPSSTPELPPIGTTTPQLPPTETSTPKCECKN